MLADGEWSACRPSHSSQDGEGVITPQLTLFAEQAKIQDQRFKIQDSSFRDSRLKMPGIPHEAHAASLQEAVHPTHPKEHELLGHVFPCRG